MKITMGLSSKEYGSTITTKPYDVEDELDMGLAMHIIYGHIMSMPDVDSELHIKICSVKEEDE